MAEEDTSEPVIEETGGTEPPRPAVDMDEAAPPSPETPEVAREETRFQRTARLVFRYTAAIVIIFGLGMLLTYFVFQRPRVQELSDQVQSLQSQNEDLSAQVNSLQTQVDDLRVLGDENEALAGELAQAELHVRLLAVLADIRSAQVSLALEDGDQARSQLAGVPDGLEAMKGMLPAERQADVDSMASRLVQVLGGIDTDLFAAQSDLGVLENDLIKLENSLFITP